jgi:hypothetical protein
MHMFQGQENSFLLNEQPSQRGFLLCTILIMADFVGIVGHTNIERSTLKY